MSDGMLWLFLMAFAIAVVVFFSSRERCRFLKNRELESIEAIHVPISDQVSLDVFRDILIILGESYSLDPRLIRPDDSLQEFIRYDSWRLDAGTEKLNQWLVANGFDMKPIQVQTVLELSRIVEAARKKGSG